MTCRGMKSVFTGLAVILWLWLQVPGSSSQFLEEDCGIASLIQPKIIGGEPAGLGLHPWMALLHTQTSFRCAGSLINHWFVLTAAHCFDNGVNYIVRLGEYDRDTTEDSAHKEYEVDRGFRHMYYDNKTYTHDIALLRLKMRVEYLHHIKPICIFENSNMKWVTEEATWFTATGWGLTSTEPFSRGSRVLQKVKLNRRNQTECAWVFVQRMTSQQICVGSEDRRLCQGDSGGPQGRMVRRKFGDEYRFVQMGIASYSGAGCPVSIITDVVSYGEWIKRIVDWNTPRDESLDSNLRLY
ncbi:chymotrypsin-like protease CTRL-1 [Drosophila subpulchrella]|uniref:chymotrypsin-like protease CTRL-1 n=1 Tax=Drosophila subpulchrella TaxID=1486046 RepID=UPI0018A1A93C|nr:chymotrypsin-like protease CTRL-1 [Drosophila subpulchrella]